MKLCPSDECQHYSKATKYARKCYHEAQCWRGVLDIIIGIVKEKIRIEKSGA